MKKDKQQSIVEDTKKDIEVIPGNIDVLSVKLLATIVNSLTEIKALLKDVRSSK